MRSRGPLSDQYQAFPLGASLVRHGGFLYLYYNDVEEHTGAPALAVGRADLQAVIEGAREGRAAAWTKFAGGDFGEPGVGGDGKLDIVILTDTHAQVVSGSTREVVCSFDGERGCGALALGDLDGDQVPEMLLASRRALLALSWRAATVSWSRETTGITSAPVLANIDADKEPKILLATRREVVSLRQRCMTAGFGLGARETARHQAERSCAKPSAAHWTQGAGPGSRGAASCPGRCGAPVG